MINKKKNEEAQNHAAKLLRQTGIYIKDEELNNISVADFGLSNLDVFGAQILTLVSTEKIGVKLIVLLSGQILPEHRHPEIKGYIGKEETIRGEWGEIYLYIPGEPCKSPKAKVPENKKKFFTQWHEVTIHPGDQITLPPATLHWFQAGKKGAVIWSFSTKVQDLCDEFTDPSIIRETIIIDKEDYLQGHSYSNSL